MQRSLRRRLMAKMRRMRLVRKGPVTVLPDGFEEIEQVIDGLRQNWVDRREAAVAESDSGVFSMLTDPPAAFGLPRL